YTEARLSKIASEMLRDIDKDTVDWVPNFDDTENEPTVLPSRFPNLLVNGATGISSGYATEIPPHNLSEVLDALIYLQKHSDATLDDLMQFIKGPDFPTGGIVQGLDGIKKAYETGRGKIIIRSKTDVEELRGNKTIIRVSELPYEV
ncbi:DNA gyrase subunit A, partial [Enterococcus lactis]|uniref:DNA gyrase subunit A n=1 Tax=Enterococcus lactis TaxID=357441 RepID=UPI003907EDFF